MDLGLKSEHFVGGWFSRFGFFFSFYQVNGVFSGSGFFLRLQNKALWKLEWSIGFAGKGAYGPSWMDPNWDPAWFKVI